MNRPGSLLWLIRHQLRLGWRETTEKIKPGVMIALLLVFFIGVPGLVLALLGGPSSRVARLNALQLDLGTLLGITAGLVVLLTLMLSSAMVGALRTLFERGDLDLLLSSPIRARTVFAARALGVAVSQFLGTALFVLPIALIGIVLGFWRLLGIVPTLISLSLLATSMGLLLTLGLVRLLGVRRARTVAQILSALVGAAFFLLFQAQNILGTGALQSVARDFPGWLRSLEGNPLLAASSALWFPARGVLLEPLPVLLTLLASGLVLALSVQITGRFFLKGVQNEVRGDRRTRPSSAPVRFSGSLFGTVYRKEWRGILRDPQLISQTLLQVLYVLPAMFIFLRPRDESGLSSAALGPGLTAALVFIGGTMVSNLTRLAISAEDAPDLLRGAPLPADRLSWLKLWSIVLPVYGLFALAFLGLALGGIFLASGVLCFVGATLALGVLELWFPRATPRSDVFKRAGQEGRLWLGIAQFLILIGWVGALYGLEFRNPWGLAGLAAGLGIPLIAFMSRQRQLPGRRARSSDARAGVGGARG